MERLHHWSPGSMILLKGRTVWPLGFLMFSVVTGFTQGPSAAQAVRSQEALREYQIRLRQLSQTAGAHHEMAAWCRDHGLAELNAHHLMEAVRLDPAFAPAWKDLRYVRVGLVWMLSPPNPSEVAGSAGAGRQATTGPTNSTPGSNPDPAGANDPPSADMLPLDRRLGDLGILVLRMKATYLDSERLDSATYAKGVRTLESISDPLAVGPLCRTLSDSREDHRMLLASFLSRFDTDDATLNLVVMALTDPSPSVRYQVIDLLGERADLRIVEALIQALRCTEETILLRAVVALGSMQAQSAAPALIEVLHGDQPIQNPLTFRQYMTTLETTFAQPVMVQTPAGVVSHPPQIAIRNYQENVTGPLGRDHQAPAPLRTEAQEALIAITGRNFGFDVARWKRWLRETPSLLPAIP